jgi:hypothetical protein
MNPEFLKQAHDQGYVDTLVALGLFTKESSMDKEAIAPLIGGAIAAGRVALPWIGRGLMAAGRGIASGIGRMFASRGAGAGANAIAGQAAKKAPGLGSKLMGTADKAMTANMVYDTVRPHPPQQQMGPNY